MESVSISSSITGAAGDPYEDFIAAASPEPGEPWIEDEMETLSINYTSGTTGRPKGVMIHHRGGDLNAVGELLATGLAFDSKYLGALPMVPRKRRGVPRG